MYIRHYCAGKVFRVIGGIRIVASLFCALATIVYDNYAYFALLFGLGRYGLVEHDFCSSLLQMICLIVNRRS